MHAPRSLIYYAAVRSSTSTQESQQGNAQLALQGVRESITLTQQALTAVQAQVQAWPHGHAPNSLQKLTASILRAHFAGHSPAKYK